MICQVGRLLFHVIISLFVPRRSNWSQVRDLWERRVPSRPEIAERLIGRQTSYMHMKGTSGSMLKLHCKALRVPCLQYLLSSSHSTMQTTCSQDTPPPCEPPFAPVSCPRGLKAPFHKLSRDHAFLHSRCPDEGRVVEDSSMMKVTHVIPRGIARITSGSRRPMARPPNPCACGMARRHTGGLCTRMHNAPTIKSKNICDDTSYDQESKPHFV
ncbi:hypothetical protein C8Q80DRAFT_26970 [Daedaleopsis nitida]|nr:hypothetical protein C8Q80DRAFT_26970 [Daedaleopsis nitida]